MTPKRTVDITKVFTLGGDSPKEKALEDSILALENSFFKLLGWDLSVSPGSARQSQEQAVGAQPKWMVVKDDVDHNPK